MKKYCVQCGKSLAWQKITHVNVWVAEMLFCKNPSCPCYNLLQIGEDIDYVKALKQHKKEQKYIETKL